MLEEAQLSKSYLNVHFQSSQELLLMCLPGCAPMYTPPCNMLFSFQCVFSDCRSTCCPLKLLPEFIPGKLLLMQFRYIPVFLHPSTLLFHILCHFEGGLQFTTFFKLILIYNSVLQPIHSSSQSGATCEFNTVTIMSPVTRCCSRCLLCWHFKDPGWTARPGNEFCSAGSSGQDPVLPTRPYDRYWSCWELWQGISADL